MQRNSSLEWLARKRDSFIGTLIVALVLCIVCSVVVSSAAVLLRPLQETNKKLDQQRNVLTAAGRDVGGMTSGEIENFFTDETKVRRVLIELSTGEPVNAESAGIDLAVYDPKKAAKSPELSHPVATDGATPGVARREKYAFVYQMMKEGQVELHVLPIYGKGLWSTLYGFLALESNTRTVRGITFYEHKETPGLGGEVDNPAWKALWQGKEVFDDQWEVDFRIIKGKVNPGTAGASHEVDGLSGATITSRGVSDSVQYWLGDDGFGKYLENQRK
ncbi:MAG: Na(+)-translocating NADH-quinone reductase subunit C [Pirellulales bacterium]|nr:Na(+)-translocating NADH-quinone reductase subunit C [Pirellulales bacterium]